MVMANRSSGLPVRRLGEYVIASADMFYSEVGQREICVYDDPKRGVCIWGEITNGGANTSIDLCQVFLEYGLFCQTLQNADQSYEEMRSFGESLGSKLADYIKDTPLFMGTFDPGACALEIILEAVHAHLTIEHIGPEIRFIVAGCPLLDASERTGLTEIELAQFGFNVMCQRLIQIMDPQELLYIPPATRSGQIFTLIQPLHLALEN
jgi:hypothetical protein